MAKMKWFDWLSISLILIGGLAWGVFAVSRFIGHPFLLVDYLTFGWHWLANIVYLIVGVASIFSIYSLIKLIFKD